MERIKVEELTNTEMDIMIGELLLHGYPAPFVQFFGPHMSDQRINLGQWFRNPEGKAMAFGIIHAIAERERPDMILFGADGRTVCIKHDKLTEEQRGMIEDESLTVSRAVALGLGEAVEVLNVTGNIPDGTGYSVMQIYRREPDGGITLLERTARWVDRIAGNAAFFQANR